MKRSWLLGMILVASATVGCGGVYGGYYATVPPPPVRAEVYGPAPGPGFAWVSGYYGWRGGRYEWVGGHWAHPPRPRAFWEPGRWEPRGGRYYFREGRWR
jgi:YXWGXW repeat-containing protein